MGEWRDIPGFEGIYQASTNGDIRTCEGKTTYSVLHGVRQWKQRIIKPTYCTNSKGRVDARVKLWKDKKPKTFLVSRLVALTWCAGYKDGLTVNHIDGNPLNNAANNLEWVTLAENIRKGFATGLYRSGKAVTVAIDGKERCFNSLSAASQYLGHSKGYLQNAIKRGRVTTDKWQIK